MTASQTSVDPQRVATRITRLTDEHKKLDIILGRLPRNPFFDDERTRYKKRKLRIKDIIAGLERQLQASDDGQMSQVAIAA